MPEVELRDVLEHFGVPVKQKGAVKCFVPSHDDRIASCSLDLRKNVWHCHACGNGGGPLEAIMALEGIKDRAGAANYAAANGLGGGDATVRGERGRIGRVPAGKGYRPKYKRHVPAWKRTGE